MAVLYRAHHHAMKLDLELTRRGVPFVMRSGVRFFEQAHVKDVLAWLRIVVNPRDEAAWRRVLLLLPGVGKVTTQKVWAALAGSTDPLAVAASPETGALLGKGKRAGWTEFVATLAALRAPGLRTRPWEMIEIVLRGGYQKHLREAYADAREREEDLLELALFAQRFESADALLGQLSLETDGGEFGAPGEEGEEEGAVVLSTIHQAKGLEWRVVFVPWLAHMYFPTMRAHDAGGDALEEERRLFYVAVTRAKDQLYLSCPQFGRDGRWVQQSDFLRELDRDLYDRWDAG
jgi:DNA helicase-2/ATP-dependent DNA helicase PcrA